MSRTALLTVALTAVVGGAIVWTVSSEEGEAGRPPLPLESERAPEVVHPGLVVSGKRPRRMHARPPPALSAEELARRSRRTALWERALALYRMGRSTQALALLEPLLADNKAFFAEPERAKLLAAIREAARSVVDVESADDRLRKLVDELLRWGNLRPADDPDLLEQQLRHAAAVIAQLKDKREREQLLQHLQRFLVPRRARDVDSGTYRSGARVDIGSLLDAVRARESRSAEPTIPLPIADAEQVEARRMEQLDLLRQRGALSLLDSLHAGLAFLALHQGPSGRLCDGDALGRCEQAYEGDNGALAECRKHLNARSDQFAVSTTALALMAFLDFRDQDGRGLFEPTIARAVAWLRAQQAESGLFPKGGRAYYSDAIALMALAQAAGASGDATLRAAVARGLEALQRVRGPEGGYRYRAGQAGDLSATGWVAQAVEYAAHAGIAVPAGMREGLVRFLDLAWLGGAKFDYLSNEGRRGGSGRPSLYPVGMLMGRILWDPDALTRDDAKAWTTWLTDGVGRRAPALYTLYYGVRMDVWMHQKLTKKWHDWLLELSRKQFQTLPLAGAFSRANARYLATAGTTATTALTLLTMEHALFLR